MGNRIIKPGQQFHASADEIPVLFRDTVECLDQDKLDAQAREEDDIINAPEENYKLKHRGGGWWDVVNERGKVINEKSMKKAEAEQLRNTLL